MLPVTVVSFSSWAGLEKMHNLILHLKWVPPLNSYEPRATGKAIFFFKPISFRKQTEAIYTPDESAGNGLNT